MIENFLLANSAKEQLLKLEDRGIAARLDPHRETTSVMKGPFVSIDDLSLLQTVKDIVRFGRVKSIADMRKS